MSHLNKEQYEEVRDWYVKQNPTPETSRALVGELCEQWGLAQNQVISILVGRGNKDTKNVYVKFGSAKPAAKPSLDREAVQEIVEQTLHEILEAKMKPYVAEWFNKCETRVNADFAIGNLNSKLDLLSDKISAIKRELNN